MTMDGKLGVTDLTFAEKGFDGVLLKPANLDSLRKLLT